MRKRLASSVSASWAGRWRRTCSKAGYPLVVNSRSQGPVDELVAAGATRAASPAEVAALATRIITMVPDGPDVELVLEGPGRRLHGAAARHHRHRHEQHRARRGAAAGGARAATSAARCSTRRSAAARSAPSTARCRSWSAATRATFDAARPILDVMGNPEKVVYIGEAGAGQLCKLCNQMVIGGTLAVRRRGAGAGDESGRRSLARPRSADGRLRRQPRARGPRRARHPEDVHARASRPISTPRTCATSSSTLAEIDTPAPVTAIVQQLLHATMAAGHGELDNSVMATASSTWRG